MDNTARQPITRDRPYFFTKAVAVTYTPDDGYGVSVSESCLNHNLPRAISFASSNRSTLSRENRSLVGYTIASLVCGFVVIMLFVNGHSGASLSLSLLFLVATHPWRKNNNRSMDNVTSFVALTDENTPQNYIKIADVNDMYNMGNTDELSPYVVSVGSALTGIPAQHVSQQIDMSDVVGVAQMCCVYGLSHPLVSSSVVEKMKRMTRGTSKERSSLMREIILIAGTAAMTTTNYQAER